MSRRFHPSDARDLAEVVADLLLAGDTEPLEQAWQQVPVGFRDQMQAATLDVTVMRALMAAIHGMRTVGLHRDMLVRALELLLLFAAGEGSRCPHVHPDRPQPIYAALWSGDKVSCRACHRLDAAAVARDPIEDRTCDLCGAVDLDGLHVAFQVYPPLTLSFGMCSTCRAAVEAEAVAVP